MIEANEILSSTTTKDDNKDGANTILTNIGMKEEINAIIRHFIITTLIKVLILILIKGRTITKRAIYAAQVITK